MTTSLNKDVLPGHEPVIQGGSPSIDYTVIDHNPVSAKNAHTHSPLRIAALQLAYTALMPRIFGSKQPRLNDLKELYELAEYNVRFILNDDINLEYMSDDEKLRKVIDKYK